MENVDTLEQKYILTEKLLGAAYTKDFKAMRKCIDLGAFVNAILLGETALALTAANGDADGMKLLLESGARVNTVILREFGTVTVSPNLFRLANRVQLMALGHRPENDKDTTALITAAKSGSLSCVNMLLKSGADVNYKDKTNRTALCYASNGKVCEALLLAGAPVTEDCEAIKNAARNGYDKCLELLIRKGASVNVRNRQGETPLHLAATGGHHRCIGILIRSGASVNDANHSGETPLICAAYNGHHECLKVFIQSGACVNTASRSLTTPLIAAAGCHEEVMYSDQLMCLQVLLKAGARVNMCDNRGNNALWTHMAHSGKLLEPRRMDPRILTLLWAAGEINPKKKRSQSGHKPKARPGIPTILWQKIRHFPATYETPNPINQLRSMKEISRENTRHQLLKSDPHTNLFFRVPKLGLPTMMREYMLFDMSLDILMPELDLVGCEVYLDILESIFSEFFFRA